MSLDVKKYVQRPVSERRLSESSEYVKPERKETYSVTDVTSVL